MKNLLKIKPILVGIVGAIFAGYLWHIILTNNGEAQTLEAFATQITVIPPIIGLVIGLIGKQTGSSLQRIFFSALAGVGLGPLTVIPLMGTVALPLGKLAEQFGLINPATMPSDVATQLAASIMSAIWLVAGSMIGVVLLFVSFRKPAQATIEGSQQNMA